MKPIPIKRICSLACLLLALCLLFGACEPQPTPENPEQSIQQTTEQQTTEQQTTPPLPETEYPTADDLDANADFSKLIISAVYAGGESKKAPVKHSYVCLYNTGKVDLALQGLALFACGADYVWRQYELPFGATVPAGGYYLVVGASTQTQMTVPVLETAFADAQRPDMLLGGNDFRLAIAPVGTQLQSNVPVKGQAGVVDYLSAHTLDSTDLRHYIEGFSKDDLIRRVVGSGHNIGLLALGATAAESRTMLTQGNRLLASIARTAATAALAPADQQAALTEDGWACWRETTGAVPRQNERPAAYTQRITSAMGSRRTARLTLDDSAATARVLPSLLRQLEESDRRVLLPLEPRF